MNNNRNNQEAPPGRTPNVHAPTQLNEVRGLTIANLPHFADPFLEPHDQPLAGDSHVYVVWRGRRPGLYWRWENASRAVHAFPHARHHRFVNITNARVAYYLLHPDYLRDGDGTENNNQGQQNNQVQNQAQAEGNRAQEERANSRQGSETRSTSSTREPSPHSSDEYWAASDDFVEVNSRMERVRLTGTPVLSPTISSASSVSSQATAVGTAASMRGASHSTAGRASNTSEAPAGRPTQASSSRASSRSAGRGNEHGQFNVTSSAEAGPSSGRRQSPRNTWTFEGDEQECLESEWLAPRWAIVVVGLDPGVYPHIGTARIASGLLPGTVILTAATEEEANTIFVEQYMRQRVRRLYE